MVIVSGGRGGSGKGKPNRSGSEGTGKKNSKAANTAFKAKRKIVTKDKGEVGGGGTKKKGLKHKPLSKKTPSKGPTHKALTKPGPPSPQNTINKNKLEKMVTSNNGPRIHAQRKFAQAGNVYSGTLQSNTSSPTVTPIKATPVKRPLDPSSTSASKKQSKKPPFSPPANKRPRTDDFLTFLCFRGTPALPPDLDFFNFPQVHEVVETQTKKKGTSSVSLALAQAEAKHIANALAESKLPDPKSNGSVSNHATATSNKTDVTISKLKGKGGKDKDENGTSNKAGLKTLTKQSVDKSKKKTEDCLEKSLNKSTTKSTAPSSGQSSSNNSKAENPTKGIMATASNVLFSKMKKTPLPVKETKVSSLSPTRSRLNEQDARFAMTALKLKYQRMASSKPNRALLLTKKVKDRSVILTRSKSRSGKPSLSPKRKTFPIRSIKPKTISPSRNAPSPDIIFGVTSSTTPIKRQKPPSSGSGTESETKASSESDNSESEHETKSPKGKHQQLRSLRSGKELSRPKSPPMKKPALKKIKIPETRRVGTRSAFRTTNSPLRELPMYKVTDTKVKSTVDKHKGKKSSSKDTKNEKVKNEVETRRTTRSKKVEKDTSGKRPSRKTKETAAFYLQLHTTGFSTDEEDGIKRDDEEEDSELGSSSSSETKFLEKHYNAGLKRNEDKKGKSKSQSKSNRRNSVSKSRNKKDSDSESSSSSKSKSLRKTNTNKSKKNLLKSKATHDSDSSANSSEEETEKSQETSRSKKNFQKSKNTKTNANSENHRSLKEAGKRTSKQTASMSKKKIHIGSDSGSNSSSETEKRKGKSKKISVKSKARTKKGEDSNSESTSSEHVAPRGRFKSTKLSNQSKSKNKKVHDSDSGTTSSSEVDKSKEKFKSSKSSTKSKGKSKNVNDSDSGSTSSSEVHASKTKKPTKPSLKSKSITKSKKGDESESGSTSSSELDESKTIRKYKKTLSKSKIKDRGQSDSSGSDSESKLPEKMGKSSVPTRKSQDGRNLKGKSEIKSNSKPSDDSKSKNGKVVKKSKVGDTKTKTDVEEAPNDRIKKSNKQNSSSKKESSPKPVRKRQTTPTVGDRKMPGAARKSASIVPRRSQSQQYSSSSGDEQSSTSDVEEKGSEDSDNDQKVKRPGQTTKKNKELKSNSSSSKSKKLDAIEKSMDSGAAIESRDRSLNKSDANIMASSRRSSGSSRLGNESKTIASEMRRLVEQKRAVEAFREVPSSPSSKSPGTVSRREESVETEKCKISSRDNSRSPANSSSSSSSSASGSEESSDSSDDGEAVEPPTKVDMSTQVDMDAEDGIVTESMTEREQSQEQPPQIVIESDDDDIQEIAQVFSSSTTSTIHQFTSHHRVEEHSVVSGTGRSSASTLGYATQHHHHHSQHHHHQQQHHLHHEQQQQMGMVPPPQFNPFAVPQPSTEFYTPLQLTPSPLVHSRIQLVGSGIPTFPGGNHLNTLNTMSIPVSVPHISSLSSHLLPPPPLGFAAGSTFHSATTLQTHIRSVATNLDIPLVRPAVGSDPAFNFMNRTPVSMGYAGMNATGGPLTRPHMGMWSQPPPVQVQQSHMDNSRNYYSAFRVPHQMPQQHQHSSTVLGTNFNPPELPVSIVQPQAQSHQQSFQSQKSNASSTSKQGTSSQHQHPTKSNSYKKHSSSSSSSTTTSANTANPPGYNIIKNLPNVSIVPKFDRNSKSMVKVPCQEPGPSVSTSETKEGKGKSKNKSSEEKPERERKKVGRKKKETMILPQPSSPLTVRKDSNPATYVGTSKKQSKKEGNVAVEERVDEIPIDGDKKEKGDKFNKLLKMKKGKERNSPGPSHLKNIEKESADQSKSSDVLRPEMVAEKKEEIPLGIREAPTYYPTDHEFEDPLKYIQKIQRQAEQYGMARIVPPRSFRPECNVEDDMRFTAYNHYIHKMYQRWGPTVLETQMIKENLRNSQVDVLDSPMIGGMEVNLSALYQTVQSFGGLKEVIEKERWTKVADTMHIPKAAHDRATKLDGIYVKYVLPYEILSDGEREKLKKKVEKLWTKRKDKILRAAENSDEEDSDGDSMDELDECIVKGKTTPLSTYFRVARNTQNIFFPTEKKHSTEEIEEEYWRIVRDRDRPVCVYSGSIDCAGVGWGFPIPKASSKHPWNLKVLANNQGSVLRSMGPVMGATVPTLHVSMLFTTYCWYRDPHSLPWVEYLHSGANKIWYSVPADHEDPFRDVLTELMPMQCKKKKIWLASDSAMVPPEMLIAKGVPVVRAVQNPGEFLVVFPKSYTSAICTGYLISESVCFAYPSWLESGLQTFKDIRFSKEPPVFPLEKLLLSILQDARASLEVVRMALPPMKELLKEDSALRYKVTSLGVKHGGKISRESSEAKPSSKKKGATREEEIEQCYYCNYLLYLSMVRNKKTDSAMCLKHAVEHFARHKADIKKCTLLYDFDEEQLAEIVENASKRCGNLK